MYIELTKRTTYTAEISGRTLAGLEKESEWNGQIKLVQPETGLFLIVMPKVGLIVDGSESLIDELLAPTVEPGYVHIPGRTIKIGNYSIEVAPFSVAQLMGCVDADGKAYVSETEKPRVNINYYKSVEACKLAGGGLIRGSQHIAIGMDIMSVDANWSGGKVGEGILRRGLHRGTVSGAQPGTYVSPHADENRYFLLPDGSSIRDYSGHIFSWMFDDIHGDANGLTGKIPADSPYLTFAAQFTREQGIGWLPSLPCDWSGRALIRGGCWYSGGVAGVFSLDGGWPVGGGRNVGFRSTKP
jgi:hypothetical protein